MSEHVSPRILMKLTAAEGYLELDMPENVIAELDAVDDFGPYEAVAQFYRGEALMAQHRYEDAIEPLQKAASMFPPRHRPYAWKSLSECFRQGGWEAMAEAAEMFAAGPPPAPRTLNINIQVQPMPPPPVAEEDEPDSSAE